jgi:hypothetical protein
MPSIPPNVVVHARGDFTGLYVGKKTDGHELQMLEHGVAHIEHDVFGNPAVQIVLPHGYQAADYCGAKRR